MEAIVLAGGFGTRLSHIVKDVPKPMAPINDSGLPFLSILMDFLERQGVRRIVLATGHLSSCIEQYFGDSYHDMSLIYSVETTPLLTGGAVKKALLQCTCDSVFVLNGDTFFDVNLQGMREQHIKAKADFSIAIKKMHQFDRYGTVVTNGKRVVAFREKAFCEEGWINGGIYCINRDIFTTFPPDRFSLEKDYMEKKLEHVHMMAYPSEGYFIDIGVPEDYFSARKKFGIYAT
jgi:D-glycero-D-manno-heptose 1-phosphate guanosyltransferase